MRRQIHNLTPAEALELLGSKPEGVSSTEAAQRRLELGPNTLDEPPRFRALEQLARHFTNLFGLLLTGAAVLCFVAEGMAPGEGMSTLGVALLGVAVLNAVFTFAQEMRAERAMAALRALLPSRAHVLRGGVASELEVSEVVPGDVVLLAEGDRVVADARLIESEELWVNNAPLTGEARDVAIHAEPRQSGPLLEADNLVFAGCSVVRGRGKAVVFATGRRTEFGKVAMLSATVDRPPTPMEQELSRMIRVLTIVAVVMGAVFFAYGVVRGRPIWVNLVFMMGIIVANVPEGLLPTFTLSLAMGAMRLARRNVLVKSLAAVEALGSVQVICTDKTGTLTANQLALSATLSAEGVAIQGDARRRSLECALVASQIRVSQGGLSGDSLDVVVAEAVGAETREAVLRRQQRIFPFDVARRRSAGTRRHDDGLELCMKGAWEAIAPSVVAYQSGDVLRPFGAEEKDRAEALVRRLAGGGARVIAVARRAISLAEGDRPIDELERELELLGLLCFSDPLRPEVPAAVARCRSAGIEVTLITGDHPETARAIAREAGIIHEIQAPVLTGADLAATTEAELAALLADVHVFARTTPEQKLKIVAAFRRRGLRVAMTGDGVNDAPALRAADVGVAMGKSGTDVAREAAQIVLLDDNFASIVAGIEEGRTVFANMRKFLTYVLASNVPEIIPFLLYVVLPVPLALTVVQILVIDLGTDLLPAIGLGREPPAADVMRAPPRASNDRLLDRSLLARAYLFLGLIEAGFSTGLFFLYLVAGGWRYGDDLPTSSALYHSATGLTLTTVILMQIGNLVGRRSETRSGLDAGLVQNTLLILGIVTELIVCVAVLYVPAVASFLRTGPVPLPFLGLALMGPVLLFFFDRMRKRLFVSVR